MESNARGNMRTKMRVAVVCGDGLPVSGLLTTLRNVVDLIAVCKGCPEIIDFPMPTDLGYSWRPDKAGFFPQGPQSKAYPPWMSVSTAVPLTYEGFGDDLVQIRRQVAVSDSLPPNVKEDLRLRIDKIALPYEQYFSKWLADNHIDWIIAINMTLSDAVPVTQALHQAAMHRWGSGRPGGIVFWDHDLFGSYAVTVDAERIYPKAPNIFTPVPQNCAWHIWALASPVLALETKQYTTDLEPRVVPLVLPTLAPQSSDLLNKGLVRDFLVDLGLLNEVLEGHRIILCPVRIFPVKGIDISLRLLAAVNRLCSQNGWKSSYLLIFGDLDEDRDYAALIREVINEQGIADQVRFLGGVPLATVRHGDRVKLDEKDLLSLCAASGGGVFFTPSVADVESVGLGPALAALAGVPCAVTNFNAFAHVYGEHFHVVRVDASAAGGLDDAARAFVNDVLGLAPDPRDDKNHEPWRVKMATNRALLAQCFPTQQWRLLLSDLASRIITEPGTLAQTRRALGMSSKTQDESPLQQTDLPDSEEHGPRRPWGFQWRSHALFAILTVGLGMFTDAFLYGLVVPILPSILEDHIGIPRDKHQFYTSQLLSSFAIASVVLSPFAGALADAVKSRRMPFLAGLAALIVATILLFTARTIPLLVIARVLQGASTALVWTVGLALCRDTVGSENLGKTIGSIFSFVSVGTVFAPVAGGTLYRTFGTSAVACLALSILGIDFLMRVALIEKTTSTLTNPETFVNDSALPPAEDSGAQAHENHENTPLLYNSHPSEGTDAYAITTYQPWFIRQIPIFYCFKSPSLSVALFMMFFQGILLASFDATIPLHARDLFSFDSMDSGLLFAPLGVCNLVAGPLAGWAVDHYGARPIAAIGYVWLVPVFALLRLPKPEPYIEQVALYAVLLGLAGVGLGIINSPAIVEAGLTVERYHKRNITFFGPNGPYAQLYGISNMMFCLGLSVGPILAGGLRTWIGYGNMNAVLSALAAAMAAACTIWLGRM